MDIPSNVVIFFQMKTVARNTVTVCADTNPPSNCTPREEVREDSNNQDTTIPPPSGVEDDSNNDNTGPSIPPTSGAQVEDDILTARRNTSPRIPTKGDGLSTLDGDKGLVTITIKKI